MAKLICLVGLLGLLGSSSAHAEILQLDSFQTGNAAGFQAGFIVGEAGAVRLKTNDSGDWQLTRVLLLFGGATTQETVTLNVYAGSQTASPGALLFSGDFQVTGSNENMSELNLSAENLIVSGNFRVSIAFQHAGLPSIARDDDGTIATALNFMDASGVGWINSNLAGLTGDWIIRADVTKLGGGASDAGPISDASTSTPDSGTDANSSANPDAGSSGESCSLHSDCERGAHCGDQSVCTVECRADIDCSSDNVCDTTLGRCDPPKSSGGCSSSGSGSPSSSSIALLSLLCLLGLGRRRRA